MMFKSPEISSDFIPSKIFWPKTETEEGIEICERNPHFEKHKSPIDFTEDGIVICASDSHPEKLDFPMDSTEHGMIISSRDTQLANAKSPIETTEEGMDIFIKYEQPSNIWFGITFNSPEILMHSIPSKILRPKQTTDEGIVISSSDEQLANAKSPIVVTDVGIVKCFNEKHKFEILNPFLFLGFEIIFKTSSGK